MNGITQEKLAEHLCISYQAVSKWECGLSSPDLSIIVSLTKLFGISADELLGLSGSDDDQKRKRYNTALQKYRNSHDYNGSYWWAKEATLAYPKDYDYLEWLAYSEYGLVDFPIKTPEELEFSAQGIDHDVLNMVSARFNVEAKGFSFRFETVSKLNEDVYNPALDAAKETNISLSFNSSK